MQISKEAQKRVEAGSESLTLILDELSAEYVKPMDDYVDKIKRCLEDGISTLTLDELNKIMLRLSAYNYFLAGKIEKAGIKSSVAQAIRDEAYNKAFRNQVSGTVAQKTAVELEAITEEEVVNIVYQRLYKAVKAKYDSTVRLIEGLRKIITAKIEEMKLAQIKGGNQY